MSVGISMEACYNVTPYTPPAILPQNAGFNGIGKSIVDGLNGGLPDSVLEELSGLLFGKNPTGLVQAVEDLVKSQAGGIALFVLGLVLALILLIGSIVMCVYSCTCRKKWTRRTGNGCLIAALIIGVVSFGFVCAGTVLYSIAAPGTVDGIQRLPDASGTIADNLKNTTTGISDQLFCSVKKGLYSIEDDLNAVPDDVKNSFLTASKLDKIITYDYTGTQTNLADIGTRATNLEQLINDELKNAKITPNASAVEQLNKALTDVSPLAASIGGLTPMIAIIKEQANKTNTVISVTVVGNVRTQVKGAVDTLDAVLTTVTKTITDINTTVKSFTDEVTNIVNEIKRVSASIDKIGAFGWIKFGFIAIIAIPAVFIMIMMLCGLAGGTYRVCQKKSVPSRGCCSLNCTMLTACIITLVLGCLIFIYTAVAFALGYGVEVACKPLFYDDSFHLLTFVDKQIGLTVQGMDNKTIPIKFSSTMKNCKDGQAILSAIGGQGLIDVNTITQGIKVADLIKDIGTSIDAVKIGNLDIANLATALKTAKEQVDNLKALKFDVAHALDPYNVNKIQDDNTKLAGELDATVTSLKNLLKDVTDGKLTTEADIKTSLKGAASSSVNNVAGTLNTTASEFSDSLLTKAANCSNVYRTYKDVGTIGCEQIGGPIQGMWLGAGMAALFIIPAAIMLGCISNISRGRDPIYTMKDQAYGSSAQRDTTVAAEYLDEDEDPFQKPYLNTAYDPLEGGAITPYGAVFAGESIAPLAGVAPVGSMYPAVDHEDDPWASNYKGNSTPSYYGAGQPDAGGFVDPLAAPAPYTSAYPSIPQGNSSRYYDSGKNDYGTGTTGTSSTRGLTRF